MTPAPGLAPWTEADDARLAACHVHVALRTGRELPIEDLAVTFRPRFAADERMLASGPFELLDFRAKGDGSYQKGGAFFLGTGPIGLAATGVVAAASYGINRNRKRQAADDAQPRWLKIDAGRIVVSDRGFYLDTRRGLHAWNYADIDQVQMVGPGELLMAGIASNGPVRWVVRSPWAELIFVVWVNRYQPRHPQLDGGAWLPPGWIDHVRAHGHAGPIEAAAGMLGQ